MAITPRIVATQGVRDGPQQTAAQGLLPVQAEVQLAALLVASPSLTATLTVGEEQGGGRKKKNPLVRVQIGTKKPVEVVEAKPKVVVPEIELLPVEKRGIEELAHLLKPTTEQLLKGVLKSAGRTNQHKQHKQHKQPSAIVDGVSDEDEEMMALALLLMDD